MDTARLSSDAKPESPKGQAAVQEYLSWTKWEHRVAALWLKALAPNVHESYNGRYIELRDQIGDMDVGSRRPATYVHAGQATAPGLHTRHVPEGNNDGVPHTLERSRISKPNRPRLWSEWPATGVMSTNVPIINSNFATWPEVGADDVNDRAWPGSGQQITASPLYQEDGLHFAIGPNSSRRVY